MIPRIITKEERTIIDGAIAYSRSMISHTVNVQEEDGYFFYIGALNLLTRARKKRYVNDSVIQEFDELYSSNVSAAAVPCSSDAR